MFSLAYLLGTVVNGHPKVHQGPSPRISRMFTLHPLSYTLIRLASRRNRVRSCLVSRWSGRQFGARDPPCRLVLVFESTLSDLLGGPVPAWPGASLSSNTDGYEWVRFSRVVMLCLTFRYQSLSLRSPSRLSDQLTKPATSDIRPKSRRSSP